MSEGMKIERWKAWGMAQTLITKLGDVCQRAEIAGSLRRGKEMVGDIEIVCVPHLGIDLFGATSYSWGDVRDALAMFKMIKGGDHYQQYDLGTCKADVFVTSLEQWGVIYTIRTGSSQFSHNLVTPKEYGGLMPEGMRILDGRLWKNNVSVETLEEADLFREMGMKWIRPEER
jgi:DNA polymerase/3'-5' exonuclease PolX